jgi:hypothetical protein
MYTSNDAWKKILVELIDSPQDVATIYKNGHFGKWFHATQHNGLIFIGNAKSHFPSCNLKHSAIISKEDFIKLYPNYRKWRSGELSREKAKAGTFVSSYVFGLISRFCD